MGVGTVTVVIAGVAAAADESSSALSSSIRGTAGASDERSFRIFLLGQTTTAGVTHKTYWVGLA